MYSEIHVWGDSLARGVIYNEEKGRYAISRERCTNRLQEALSINVINHSVMGATVRDGLEWFSKFKPIKGALCAVEFGGNDCDLDWKYVSEHPEEKIVAKVDLEEFQDDLRRFVTEIRRSGMIPLLVTPLPLVANRYFKWVSRGLNADAILHALGDVNHIYRWQERYAIAVRNVAQEMHCQILDTRDLFLAQEHTERLMCIDGIHPNDAGHRVIAEEAVRRAQKSGYCEVADDEASNAVDTVIPSLGILQNVI